MKKIFQLILLIATIVLFSQCIKEYDIDLNDIDSKLVINSAFTADTSLSVNISVSQSLQNENTVLYHENAIVELYENDIFQENLTYDGNGNYISVLSTPDTEKEYKIIVSADDYDQVNASSKIPEQVSVILFEYFEYEPLEYYAELTFNDPEDSQNYYLCEIRSKYTLLNNSNNPGVTTQTKIVPFHVLDPVVENGAYGSRVDRVFFSDELISGQEYTLELEFDISDFHTEEEENTMTIKFKSISEEYYNYLKSYVRQDGVNSTLYTNVENGYGVFAGYSAWTDTITVQ